MIAETMQSCNKFLSDHFLQNGIEEATVLEVGAGSFSHFVIPPRSTMVSYDISFGQLKRNFQSRDRVQGDVHTLPIYSAAVDQIICFNVVEHLNNPLLALEEMYRTLKPGGFLVLGFPDSNSLKGILTRATSLHFHRWYYRRAIGKKDRGEGHFEAFETRFAQGTSVRCIKKWFTEKKCSVLFDRHYDGVREYRITSGRFLSYLLKIPYYSAGILGWFLTAGFWKSLSSDILFVVAKSSVQTDSCFMLS